MGVLGLYAVWVKNREFYVAPEYGSKYGVKCRLKIWGCGCMLFLIFKEGQKWVIYGVFGWILSGPDSEHSSLLSWWKSVKTYGISKQMRSSNKKWDDLLIKISNKDVNDLKWEEIDDITVTNDFATAERFYIDDVDLTKKIPLDRQWICSTNHLVNEVNNYFHQKRNELLPENHKFGIVHAITNVEKELPASSICKNLTYLQRLDFARNWIFPDLPDPSIEVQYGEPMTLMRNTNTYEGIVKNKRCWIISKFGQCVVVEFEGGLQKTIPKINFETSTNGIKFTRTQLPFKHFYAGTVHKSQGMTLSKVVIDLRSGFWEHGMLYVSLSRVRDPKNICILLPKVNSENDDDSNHFVQPVADIEIVNLVKEIENDVRVKSSNTDNQDQPDLNNDSQKQNQSNQENANETNFQKTLQSTDEFLIDFENEIDDLLPNFIETRKYQKEKDMSFSLKRNDLVGLNNYKNTCYINSFLQIIYHISLVKK